jgi:hypothetical protein
MRPETLELDFHGARVRLLSRDGAILADLRRDFAYFISTASERPAMVLELRTSPPPRERVPRRALWSWRSARIAQRGTLRSIDYEGQALLEYDFSSERGLLHCAEPSLLHELSYLAVMSRVGDTLDRRGLHRVHALGFSYRGQGGLLLLPSGGGKSRLGLELLGREGFGLFSDDIPLLRSGGPRLEAFPMRLGLRGDDWRSIPERFTRVFRSRRFEPKRLVDLDYFREKISPGAPLSWILVGSRTGVPKPLIGPCSKARAAAAMTANLILGIGTPQVLELMAPTRMASVAARRTACAARAVASARCGRFALGTDPADNATALEQFLCASL